MSSTHEPDATRGPAIDRRRALLGAGATVAFVAFRPWRTFVASVTAPPRRLLADVLPPSESVDRVGLAFLRSHPDEADLAVLERALLRTLDPTRSNLAAHVADVIHAEFRTRTIVRLDGWVASPTEARLAAFAFLARHSPDP